MTKSSNTKIVGRSLAPITAVSIVETFGDINNFQDWSKNLIDQLGYFISLIFFPFDYIGLYFTDFQRSIIFLFIVSVLCFRNYTFAIDGNMGDYQKNPYLIYRGKKINRDWDHLNNDSIISNIFGNLVLFILLPFMFHFYGSGGYSNELRIEVFISTYITAFSFVIFITLMMNLFFNTPMKMQILKKIYRFNLKIIRSIENNHKKDKYKMFFEEIEELKNTNKTIKDGFNQYSIIKNELKYNSLLILSMTMGLFVAFSMIKLP